MKTRLIWMAPAALALLTTAPALADPIARSYAATCANCHGTDGRSQGAMTPLAGMPKDFVVSQMKAFKEGKRPATIMHQIAKGYTDEQVELIATYFASQKR